MPWCPKCKTEYIEGIEICADCHTPLVSSLDNESDLTPQTENLNDFEKFSEHFSDMDTNPVTEDDLRTQFSKPAATYIKPEEQYKDTRSSGYMLTFVGAAGIIAVILIAADIIPLSLDPVMQYVFYAVLGVFFLVFLCMGINALKKSGEYKKRISEDAELENTLLEWLSLKEHKEQLDQCHDRETSSEEAYFACQDLMKQMLTQKKPDIKEDYMNYIIEKAYSQLYES